MVNDEKDRETDSTNDPTEGQEWLPAEEGEDTDDVKPAGAEDRDDYIDVEEPKVIERPDLSRASNAERYSRQR